MGLQSETPAWDWQQSSRGRQNSAIAGGIPKLLLVGVRVSARGPVGSCVHGLQHVYLGNIEWTGYALIEGSLWTSAWSGCHMSWYRKDLSELWL